MVTFATYTGGRQKLMNKTDFWKLWAECSIAKKTVQQLAAKLEVETWQIRQLVEGAKTGKYKEQFSRFFAQFPEYVPPPPVDTFPAELEAIMQQYKKG